jgi:hypothetical protein
LLTSKRLSAVYVDIIIPILEMQISYKRYNYLVNETANDF